MQKAQKQESVAFIQKQLAKAAAVVVAHYRGLDSGEVAKLRAAVRKNNTRMHVAKNTLTKIAAKDGAFSAIADLMKGPTALFVSKDPISAAKTVADFAKTNEKLVILGGAYDGRALDAKGVMALANMPSLDQSRAKLVGLLQAPASQLLRLFQTPGGQVARVLNAYSQK